ncbi:class I SAM-dependent RNA methyltransferase [Microbacterium sp.]|uniref:class I SAM-dependent RNA methyltransferase n=1 Tax=Microbacterium sp. TaxID=51671 RepID=UPI0039E6A248
MTDPTSALLDLDITGIAHGGTFVARHEGRVVFVSDAIPGERVRARLIPPVGSGSQKEAESKSFWRAETVEVLEPSPHRRPHVWPEADLSRDPAERPGGADLGHIGLAHQRVLKRQVLGEALDRFAGPGLVIPDVEAVDSSDGTRWRTRVTLHVDDDGRVGPYAARSHRVIEVGEHVLARPAIAEAASDLAGIRPGRVELVEPADGRVRIIRREESARRLGAARPPRRRHDVVHEQVGQRRFQVDADGFWQVHPRAASVLDAAVYGLLEDHVDDTARHFDLYGGVGLFAATLADLGARDIVTVESSARATAHARENLAPLEVTAVTARVDRFLQEAPRGRAGAVVLDPPRAGAGRAVVEAIDAMAPDAIAYVACDPVALARDLGTFRERGWQVPRLRAFDLFPHSHHFEVVALLTR